MYVYYVDPDGTCPEVDRFIDNRKVVFKKFRPIKVTQGYGIKLLKTGLFLSLRDDALAAHYERYRDCIETTQRYLIIRDEGIGDVIMTTPAIRAMREANPKCSIHYATNPAYKCLLENNPHIDRVWPLDDTYSTYRRNDYDEIIDLRMWSEKSEIRNKAHRIFTYAERTLVPIQQGKEEAILKIDQDIIDDAKKLIGYDSAKRYAAIQIGTTHYCRTWPEKRWIDLAQKLVEDGITPVLIDKKQVRASIPGVLNLTGCTTVANSVGLIAACDLLISSDTGAYHIAGALGKPFIALFGIITPEFRTKFYKGWHEDITPKGLNCLGCGDYHMSECTISGTETAICMDRINIDQVHAATRLYFKNHKRIEIEGIKKERKASTMPLKRSTRATLALIVLNEGKYLPRLIDNLFSHPCIHRIVAIDGGSTDNTKEILEKAGAEVYTHPWRHGYHDAVALQRNIMASYIPEGERFFYMDGDEIASKELLAKLNDILSMPERYICLSRRTFKTYTAAITHFETGNAVGQHLHYPDFQPRVYTNDRFLKFFRSPHHLTLNIGEPKNVIADILHYERDIEKDNKARDKQWENLVDMGTKLGLGSWYNNHTCNRIGK